MRTACCLALGALLLAGSGRAQTAPPSAETHEGVAQEVDASRVTDIGIASQPADAGGTAEGAEGALTATDRGRLADLDGRPIHQFSNVDLAEYLQLRTKSLRGAVDRPHAREDAAMFAARGLGQPFRLNAVQFDPAEADCVSCVNRQLALSIAWDWQSYVILTERIRHKDGIVEYKNRNFFTLQDWLPNNTAWLLDDVTGQLGSAEAPPAKKFTYPDRPKLFQEEPAAPGSKFKRVIFKGWDRSTGVTYVYPSLFVPTERMYEVLPDLRGGDVVLVLRRAPEGHLDCDHMGMLVREGGEVQFAHCVPPQAAREELLSFLGRCHWVVGLKFLRLKEDAREIAAKEVARLAPTVPVATPAKQDEKNARLRAGRAGAGQ